MSSGAFRQRIDRPPGVFVAIFGMLAVIGANVTRFVQAAATFKPEDGTSVAAAVAVTVAASILFSFLPLLAAWALRTAWKSAPVLVTIVGVLGASQAGYADILGVVCAVASIAAVIAVWLPSARKYGRDFRALRAA